MKQYCSFTVKKSTVIINLDEGEKKFKLERNCCTKSPYRRNQRRNSEENTIREGDKIEIAIGNFEKQRQKRFWRGNDGDGHKDSIFVGLRKWLLHKQCFI